MVLVISNSPFYLQHQVQCLARSRLSLSILISFFLHQIYSSMFMLTCNPKLASEAQSIPTSHHFEETKVYKEVHNLFSTIQNPKSYENSVF